jgi:hypothetical protein
MASEWRHSLTTFRDHLHTSTLYDVTSPALTQKPIAEDICIGEYIQQSVLNFG